MINIIGVAMLIFGSHFVFSTDGIEEVKYSNGEGVSVDIIVVLIWF